MEILIWRILHIKTARKIWMRPRSLTRVQPQIQSHRRTKPSRVRKARFAIQMSATIKIIRVESAANPVRRRKTRRSAFNDTERAPASRIVARVNSRITVMQTNPNPDPSPKPELPWPPQPDDPPLPAPGDPRTPPPPAPRPDDPVRLRRPLWGR